MASSQWSSAKKDCGIGCTATAQAQREKNDASSSATISTVGFIAGGALLAAGVALYFTAPGSTAEKSALRVMPVVGPGLAAMTLAGGF